MEDWAINILLISGAICLGVWVGHFISGWLGLR